jgi:hypothetical protein
MALNMPVSIHDYLLDQSAVDWPAVLEPWTWLLPDDFTLWLANRFCDLFIVTSDGSVHMLDVGAGTLSRLADNRDDFCSKIDEGDNANHWLMIPLVGQLVAAGIHLLPGQCYGFKIPPVIGGEYTIENCAAISIPDYLGSTGSIHDQLRGVPDGAHVRLRVIPPPKSLFPTTTFP